MKKAKPVIIFLVKLLVSGGLLAYFLSRVHLERFLQTFATANYWWIALALVIYLCTQAISAARWATLARPLGIETPFTRFTQILFDRHVLQSVRAGHGGRRCHPGSLPRARSRIPRQWARCDDNARRHVGADGSRHRHDRVGLARRRGVAVVSRIRGAADGSFDHAYARGGFCRRGFTAAVAQSVCCPRTALRC